MSGNWAKVFTTDEHGQALVTTAWDDRESNDMGLNDLVNIETRGRVIAVRTLRFSSEDKANAAFRLIDENNINEFCRVGGDIGALLGEGEAP